MKRMDRDLDFLPAALEIQQAPPSPIGRSILWTLIALLLVALGWSALGRVDIVAVAPGKIVPSSRVKVIQPVGIGRVRAIHVTDGQSVVAGQPLIELDPTLADADQERLQQDVHAKALELARLEAFSDWLSAGRHAPLGRNAATVSTELVLQTALLDQQIAEHRSKVAAVDQALERRRADLDATGAVTEKLRKTLPLVTQRAQSLKQLSESNLVARNSWLELEQQRIETEQDLATQEASLRSTRAAIEELAEQRHTLIAEARHTTLLAVEKLRTQVGAQSQELVKAREIAGQQVLASPVNGVVQQLMVHTVGGVVTPAETLMVIVPRGQPLEVEARVLNKDIGFVRAGQPATIKVEAFPFTRYGTIAGEVVNVSRDAVADEKLGLFYVARVRVSRDSLMVDGSDIPLSPGMAVSAEVTTGTRKLIEYFLSPVVQYAHESVRER
jgi:hemolysin D